MSFPPSHPIFKLTALESYQRVHHWLQLAFKLAFDVNTSLACSPLVTSTPGQCFLGYEKFDLLYEGSKIAGAAQKRTNTGLLIQGSIQPLPAFASSSTDCALSETRHAYELALCQILSKELGLPTPHNFGNSVLESNEDFISQLEYLMTSKYLKREYNEKR